MQQTGSKKRQTQRQIHTIRIKYQLADLSRPFGLVLSQHASRPIFIQCCYRGLLCSRQVLTQKVHVGCGSLDYNLLLATSVHVQAGVVEHLMTMAVNCD